MEQKPSIGRVVLFRSELSNGATEQPALVNRVWERQLPQSGRVSRLRRANQQNVRRAERGHAGRQPDVCVALATARAQVDELTAKAFPKGQQIIFDGDGWTGELVVKRSDVLALLRGKTTRAARARPASPEDKE